MAANRKHPNDDPRGNTPRANRVASAWGKGTNGGEGGQADWGTVSPVLLQALVSRVTAMGCLISFGYSRDGGAYLVSVLDGNVPHKEWIPCTTDVDLALEVLTDALG